MKQEKITVYWYANGVRVVVGDHHASDIDAAFSARKEFDSLEHARDSLGESNRAQPIIRHMLESMK